MIRKFINLTVFTIPFAILTMGYASSQSITENPALSAQFPKIEKDLLAPSDCVFLYLVIRASAKKSLPL